MGFRVDMHAGERGPREHAERDVVIEGRDRRHFGVGGADLVQGVGRVRSGDWSAPRVLEPDEQHVVTGGELAIQAANVAARVAGPAPAWRRYRLVRRSAARGTRCWPVALTLIDNSWATPGTAVTVVCGEHPGPGTDTDADLGFPRIRAMVAPAPGDAHARTRYRRFA
jgi:hypothetical protein